jgi:Xaa-Pro aminopeptidase
VEKLCGELGVRKLGFEQGRMTVDEYEDWKQKLSDELVPAGELIDDLRVCKTEREIAALTAAQRTAERAFEAVLPRVVRGKTEAQLRGELAAECYLHGAEDLAFDFIIASGENSAKPHAVPGDRVIRDGDFLTFDFGAKVNGYCSDMTRTVAVGSATEEMKNIYCTVLKAQLAGIAAARSGIPGKVIDQAARDVIEQAGYGPYFGHGFGHSVGLEIHEKPTASPANDKPLPAGAVITAEPGIYLPGRFGVRIEDMICLTEEGSVNLTRAPKELIIV